MNQNKKTLAAIKKFNKEIKTWTKQQCRDYLVKLGTHNPDGSLHKNYGGK